MFNGFKLVTIFSKMLHRRCLAGSVAAGRREKQLKNMAEMGYNSSSYQEIWCHIRQGNIGGLSVNKASKNRQIRHKQIQ